MDSSLMTTLTVDPDVDTSASTPSPATAQPASAIPAPDLGSPVANAPASPPITQGQPQAPDLPRFQRTLKNTLQAMLLGMEMGGIPGAIAGGVNPQGAQAEAQNRAAIAAANQHFASARAAHETLQAALLEKQVNEFDADHQQQMEKIGLDNLKAAQDAGFHIVSVTPLDGNVADNSAAAMNNLRQIQNNNGGKVPDGLLHIHAGNNNGIFTLQLTDPTAALDTINQTRRMQGLSPMDQNTFMAQSPQDRALQAKDAINFTFPTDSRSGQISQDSVTTLENRLALVKAQPDFTGKDAMVTKLQQSLDFQTSALEHEAQRKGQVTGAEAQAAAPGQAAAEVTKQNALAQTPQGRAGLAHLQAQTRLASAQTQEALANTEKTLNEAGLGGLKPSDPVIGYDSSGSAVMTNAKDAQGLGLHDTMKPDAAMVEKVTIARSYIALNNQLQADINGLEQAGKLGTIASRWNEFMTGKVGAGDPDFEKFRVDLGLANTALMQFHVGNRGGSQMLEHFQDLANGKKMDANTLRAGIQAEGDYAMHRAMLTPTLAKQISGETLRRGAVAPMYGVQKSTGKPVQSLDGGKTWQPRQ